MAFAYITQRRYFEYPFHVIKSLLGKGVRYLKNDEINTNRNLIHFTLNNYGNLIQLQRTWNMHKMSTFYSPSFYIKYLWRRSIRYIRYVLCADVKMTYITDFVILMSFWTFCTSLNVVSYYLYNNLQGWYFKGLLCIIEIIHIYVPESVPSQDIFHLNLANLCKMMMTCN